MLKPHPPSAPIHSAWACSSHVPTPHLVVLLVVKLHDLSVDYGLQGAVIVRKVWQLDLSRGEEGSRVLWGATCRGAAAAAGTCGCSLEDAHWFNGSKLRCITVQLGAAERRTACKLQKQPWTVSLWSRRISNAPRPADQQACPTPSSTWVAMPRACSSGAARRQVPTQRSISRKPIRHLKSSVIRANIDRGASRSYRRLEKAE